MVWKKGQSGNPKGPSTRLDAKRGGEQAMKHVAKAFKALAQVLNDPNASPSARVTAAVAILDRAYGRPAQVLDLPEMGPAIVAIERIIIAPKALDLALPVTPLLPQPIEHDSDAA